MSTYVLFDVEIHDPEGFATFMAGVKPAIESAGGRYLARGGTHTVHEGDWHPRRIVLLEFPSQEAWTAFYASKTYRDLKAVREKASSARLVSFEGLASLPPT